MLKQRKMLICLVGPVHVFPGEVRWEFLLERFERCHVLRVRRLPRVVARPLRELAEEVLEQRPRASVRDLRRRSVRELGPRAAHGAGGGGKKGTKSEGHGADAR